ncbi:3-isopropylmalate dehydratase small subunit [Halobaculum sp. CBA1158]|uniref:3-isopropylmalate dehydratase small subunit n=1 Tax=Halobaculum sp. CBA1158 TaxID=2904243 RepID=UPI001F3D625F|nr:3-isopropylmalate dehydratase small subunit [Halobaculum sp. CBA1158]UIP01083.1 3-isopropylmalate dehydratase small subunit [Halobaculum sp. CBA1158]
MSDDAPGSAGDDAPETEEAGVPAIRRVAGTGVPLRGDDVDTDQILPARFLKAVTFDDMGEYAFYDQRRDEDGELNDHPFNEYQGANVLAVNDNFGCGSSREHAPQGLMRWGVEAIVGESFAEIFQDNCKSLGIATLAVDHEDAVDLQGFIETNPDAGIEVDVRAETVRYDGTVVEGEVPDAMREALLEGIWDTTAVMATNLDRAKAVNDGLPYTDD